MMAKPFFRWNVRSSVAILLATISSVSTCSAATSRYAIVVSTATNESADWKKVVDALVEKHTGKVFTYDSSIADAQKALQKFAPRYTCFVAKPTEATGRFVAEVHWLTRSLDDRPIQDPFIDTIWGILTGYDAANALAIAEHKEPLVVRKTASGTEIALECCEQGFWYDELVKNKFVRKDQGSAVKQLVGPDDTTQALVDSLNTYQADLFVTSGHATERDWMIGFRYRNGFFRSKAGQMYGEDTKKQRIEINSPNPKVYLPIGNCLMGNIDGPDAMALAWMNDAGVKQMIGYTKPTWYGYQGWGVLDYFVEQPGRYTLAEAFIANHHALTVKLDHPDTSTADHRGLTFDRDVVAFYGDPAWSARMAPGKLAFEQTLTENNGVYTFTITPNDGPRSFDTVNKNGSQRGGRPFVAFFDHQIEKSEVVSSGVVDAYITKNFILVPRPKTCDPNQKYEVVFKAERVK